MTGLDSTTLNTLRTRLITSHQVNKYYKNKLARMGQIISEALTENQTLIEKLEKLENEKLITTRYRVMLASPSVEQSSSRLKVERTSTTDSGFDQFEELIRAKNEEIRNLRKADEEREENMNKLRSDITELNLSLDQMALQLRQDHEKDVESLQQKLEELNDENSNLKTKLKLKIDECKELGNHVREISLIKNDEIKLLEGKLKSTERENYSKIKKLKSAITKNLIPEIKCLKDELNFIRENFQNLISLNFNFTETSLIHIQKKLSELVFSRRDNLNQDETLTDLSHSQNLAISPVRAFMESRMVAEEPLKRASPYMSNSLRYSDQNPGLEDDSIKIQNDKQLNKAKEEIRDLKTILLEQKELIRQNQKDLSEDMSVNSQDQIIPDADKLNLEVTQLRRERDRINHELMGLGHDYDEQRAENDRLQMAIDEGIDYYNQLRGKSTF